jgi:hypothetical protein
MQISDLEVATLTMSGLSDGSNFTNVFNVTTTNSPSVGNVLKASGGGMASWAAGDGGFETEFGFGLIGTTNDLVYTVAVDPDIVGLSEKDETTWSGPTNTVPLSVRYGRITYSIESNVEFTGVTGTVSGKRAGVHLLIHNATGTPHTMQWPSNWFRFAQLQSSNTFEVPTNTMVMVELTAGWTTNIIGFASQEMAADVGISVYIIDEDMEGSGMPSGWAGDSGADWDYTTTVLAGSESLYLGTSLNLTNTFAAAHSELHLYALVQVKSYPTASSPLISFRAADTLTQASLAINNVGKVMTYSAGGYSAQADAAMALDTTYHVWVTFVSGGTCSVGFSTDGSKPTEGIRFTSKTGSETDVTYLTLRNTSASSFIIDNLQVSTQPIGDKL